MEKTIDRESIQYVTDEEGNRSSVIISLDLFDNMLETIEELEAHYFSHHPEEREKMEFDFSRFERLEKAPEEEQ